MWAIFEGLDKAGKTTLEWSFLKATGYNHITIDRGPAGYKTFNEVFGRDSEEAIKEFNKQAENVNADDNFFIVYCKTTPEIAHRRLKAFNEDLPYDYVEAQKILDENVLSMYDRRKVLVVDTSKTIEECTEEIVQFMNSLKNKAQEVS